MNKTVIAVAIMLILLLSQTAQAADLEEGWYVKLGGVALYGTNPTTGREFGIDWNFTSRLGTFGPFEITQPDLLWPQRMVSIICPTFGTPAGVSVDLIGQLKTSTLYPVSRLDVLYETNYDAAQMMVQLYVRHVDGDEEVIWAENRSGFHTRYVDVLFGTGRIICPSDTIYFQIRTVPEPRQIFAVIFPSLSLILMSWRAKR